MKIVLLDCQNLLRNYAFIIIDERNNDCALIDTVDTDIIINYLSDNNLNLKYILNTHHHNDHIGCNLRLKSIYNCDIYGSQIDQHRIDGITHLLNEGDNVVLFDNKLEFQIIGLDGHTIGHIGYYEKNQNWLFSGDTLFNIGCGRRFEGSAEQFYQSLQKIMMLPDNLLIYGSHEYTLDNIKFARTIIPENYIYYHEFLDYCNHQTAKRNMNLPTIPFTLESQKKFNPFLLSDNSVIKQALQQDNISNSDFFGYMRSLKDNF